MRQLTSLEQKAIDGRLKSLYIRYTEIYEEIFDHYCTELENTPETESSKIFAKLNETFAWSVVKRMEKELEKNVSKHLLVAQLDYLKFWNHGITEFLLGFVGFAILTIAILTIPGSELILVFLVLIITTTIGVFFIKRDALSFNLNHKSVSISSLTVIKRVGILNTIFVWIYVFPNVFTDGAIFSNNIFVFAMGILTVLSILYSISLLIAASKLSNQGIAK